MSGYSSTSVFPKENWCVSVWFFFPFSSRGKCINVMSKREMDQKVVTVVVGLSLCPFGQGSAPQQSPISCAAKWHWYRNVTVPEKRSYGEWWGSQGLDLLGILGPYELEPWKWRQRMFSVAQCPAESRWSEQSTAETPFAMWFLVY